MAGYSGSPGAIYPALRRLEKDGLIVGDAPDGARRRREFRLTEEGNVTLDTWLALPVTREDVALRLPELMLRFAFLTFDTSGLLTFSFLDRLHSHLADHIADLRIQHEELPLTTHGRLALECGIATLEAHERWALAARDEIHRIGNPL